jgi:hypothetical protein
MFTTDKAGVKMGHAYPTIITVQRHQGDGNGTAAKRIKPRLRPNAGLG